MMHMTFYWGREVTILFDSWHTKTWLSYSISLLACLLASIFYQRLENWRMQLKLISAKAKPSSSSSSSPGAIDEALLQRMGGGCGGKVARVGGALLFGINSGIGYLLMLAVMSFNGGVFLAVVLGLAIGYFLFRSEDENLTMILDNPCACA